MPSIRFSLCPACQAEYEALRLDPGATYTLNIMPLVSLVWPDEHPGGMMGVHRGSHQQCSASVIRLAGARTALWRTGSIPEESRELWEDARRLIPEWPGFHRLTLDARQLASLDGCAEEMDDLMGAIRTRFPNVTMTDKGGGLVGFSAAREPVATPRRRWWQFWK